MFQLYQTSRLGNLLIKNGKISKPQLERALTHHQLNHLKLGESLIELGFVEPGLLNKVLCKQKWLRSLVAGAIFVSTPVSQVAADESIKEFSFYNSYKSQADYPLLNRYYYKPQDNLVSGLKYDLSSNTGLEIGLGKANPNLLMLNGIGQKTLIPQISIFTTDKKRYLQDSYITTDKQKPRFDRYKNTIPTIYNLTLRGYSLFEQSNSETKVFQFNKIQGVQSRNFELMFTITKHF